MRNPIIEEDLQYITSQDLPWYELKDKTILVSGANGFLPAYVVDTLLNLNEIHAFNLKVIGIVRNKTKAYMRFQDYLLRKDFELLVQDVCDPVKIAQKIDIIIHAASQASPKYYGIDPVGTLKPNVIGTLNLLELASEKDIQDFIYISSGEVYGQMATEGPIGECDFGYIDPMKVRSCYGESKRMGENICISWSNQYGIPVKIIRPFHTYGPGMQLDDGRVYADFVSDIVNNRDIILRSDGSATRAFCYLADFVVGLFTVLFSGKNQMAYNIASGQETSIGELAQLMAGLYPEKKLKVVMNNNSYSSGYIKSDISRSYPDISKISELGWKQRFSLQAGFRRTIESYLKS